MLFTTSDAYVSDNSGVRIVKVMKVLSQASFTAAAVGDLLIVVCKRTMVKSSLAKVPKIGSMKRALLISTRAAYCRSLSAWFSFNDNSVMLVNSSFAPLAKRVKGPILKEMCLSYNLLGSLSEFIV